MTMFGMTDAERRRREAERRRRQEDQSKGVIAKSFRSEVIDLSKLQQQPTDYRGKPLLETLPLHLRAKFGRTQWPQENRRIDPKVMTPSRNMGSLWRRYPNGTIDIGWAYGKLSDAIDRYANGIPLGENEALAISAVFPEVRFANLPQQIVEVKAHLHVKERDALRNMCSRRLREDLFGKFNGDL